MAFLDIIFFAGALRVNICQVLKEILNSKGEDLGFQFLPRDLKNLSALKIYVGLLSLHKFNKILKKNAILMAYNLSPFHCQHMVRHYHYPYSRAKPYISN